MAWKGICAVCSILGNSLRIRAYSVMCYVFQVLARIVGRRQLDQYTLADVMFLRSWVMDYVMYFEETLDI